MTAFERRDYTELRFRSPVFQITSQVAKDRSGGLMLIEHDGDTIQVPIADVQEMLGLVRTALEASQEPERQPIMPLERPASHPAGIRHEPGEVIPFDPERRP